MEFAEKIIEIIDTERAALRYKLEKLYDKGNDSCDNKTQHEAVLEAWAHVSVMRSRILNLLFKKGGDDGQNKRDDPCNP